MRNNKMIWAIAFIALALFLALPAHAGDPARVGTAAGEQLLVPTGARGMALSGANVAYIDGLESLHWNPAGFSHLDKSAMATFSTLQIFNDVNVNYLAVGVKAGGFGNLAISFKTFDFGDIPITTNQDIEGASGATFSPDFITVGLTFSRALTDAIAIGITGKLISEEVPRASASGFAVDVGLQYRDMGGIQGLALGLAVKNIGSNLKYSGSAFLTRATDSGSSLEEFRNRPTQQDQIPSVVDLGLSYSRNFTENSTLMVHGDFENHNFAEDQYKVGVEYMWNDLIALRGGYRFFSGADSEDVLNKWTVGVGLQYEFGNTLLMFDYTYRDDEYFDGNNMFQVTLGF